MHEITLHLTIDEDELAEFNSVSRSGTQALLIPEDPSEWDVDDLRRALQWASGVTAEIVDYRDTDAVAGAAADIEARRERRLSEIG